MSIHVDARIFTHTHTHTQTTHAHANHTRTHTHVRTHSHMHATRGGRPLIRDKQERFISVTVTKAVTTITITITAFTRGWLLLLPRQGLSERPSVLQIRLQRSKNVRRFWTHVTHVNMDLRTSAYGTVFIQNVKARIMKRIYSRIHLPNKTEM